MCAHGSACRASRQMQIRGSTSAACRYPRSSTSAELCRSTTLPRGRAMQIHVAISGAAGISGDPRAEPRGSVARCTRQMHTADAHGGSADRGSVDAFAIGSQPRMHRSCVRPSCMYVRMPWWGRTSDDGVTLPRRHVRQPISQTNRHARTHA